MTAPTLRIDVSETSCPMTFVKVKVALEGLAPGDVLEAVLNSTEHPREIPPSVREDGHKVLALETSGDRTIIRIQKGEEPGATDG